jgi:hypothetical protein
LEEEVPSPTGLPMALALGLGRADDPPSLSPSPFLRGKDHRAQHMCTQAFPGARPGKGAPFSSLACTVTRFSARGGGWAALALALTLALALALTLALALALPAL